MLTKEVNIDDALRHFMHRLEKWPAESPPSSSELRALLRAIPITIKEQKKLEALANNHLIRAQKSLKAEAYEQALAELTRAAQLNPQDSRSRIELAKLYLRRAQEHPQRNRDRQKAGILAQKALELKPNDLTAKRFLRNYRRLYAPNTSKRYIAPVIIAILIFFGLVWLRGDWFINVFLRRMPLKQLDVALKNPDLTMQGKRKVDVLFLGNHESLQTEIISASLGRRNDGSYLQIAGRIQAGDQSIGALNMLLRGRGLKNETMFVLPWTVRSTSDPKLLPGDSQALSIFRWLPHDEKTIQSIELMNTHAELLPSTISLVTKESELIWDVAPPEGAAIGVEIRNFNIYEAFDKQVLVMDVAVENNGAVALAELDLKVSVDPDLPSGRIQVVDAHSPALIRGERRVSRLGIPIPLDASTSNLSLVVHVENTRLPLP